MVESLDLNRGFIAARIEPIHGVHYLQQQSTPGQNFSFGGQKAGVTKKLTTAIVKVAGLIRAITSLISSV